METHQSTNSVTKEVRRTNEDLSPGSENTMWHKEIARLSIETTTTSTSSLQRVNSEGSTNRTHDKFLLGLIYGNAVCLQACLILTIIPTSRAEPRLSITDMLDLKVQRMNLPLPHTLSVVLNYLIFASVELICLYSCVCTFRRNLEGGWFYRHPGYIPRTAHGMFFLTSSLCLVWGKLVKMDQDGWAALAIGFAHIASCAALAIVLREAHLKETECQHAVGDKDKWFFQLLILNGFALIAARLGVSTWNTLLVFIHTDLGATNRTLALYVFCGLLGTEMMVFGVIELARFVEWTVFLYGHSCVWFSFWLGISILTFEKGVPGVPLKLLPCIFTTAAFLFLVIKMAKSVKHVMDTRVVPMVSLPR